MKKTGSEIETDVYRLVRNSQLVSQISGNVYLDELRPPNSKKEDAVIIFMTALDGQKQEGKVNINVYVPDKETNGVFKKDTKRCREIERLCQDFIHTLPVGDYLFSLGRMIQTFREQKISQHFINIQLNFSYNAFKNNH